MRHLQKILVGVKNRYRLFLKGIIIQYFKNKIQHKQFCIISNDCWGAEMYKLLNRPFNTPFIGLMLMSPCYLKLLENPKYYLSLPLNFIQTSAYPSMQKLNAGISFPLAVLGDSSIEIQFLHYSSEIVAREKWDRRVKKMDWDNLYIKYDCGKDYANKELVEIFFNLPFANKLVFGKENFGLEKVYILKKYSLDAVVQFRNCFSSFNSVKWLYENEQIANKFEHFICHIASKII